MALSNILERMSVSYDSLEGSELCQGLHTLRSVVLLSYLDQTFAHGLYSSRMF